MGTVRRGPAGEAQRHGGRWAREDPAPGRSPLPCPAEGLRLGPGELLPQGAGPLQGTVDPKGPSMHRPCKIAAALRGCGRWAAPPLAGLCTVGRGNINACPLLPRPPDSGPPEASEWPLRATLVAQQTKALLSSTSCLQLLQVQFSPGSRLTQPSEFAWLIGELAFQPRGLYIPARGIQHTVTRQAHRRLEPDFHDKYGNLVLLSGVAFGIGTWTYACLQLPLVWNFSPVGRLTPKEWRED